ncbi:MAG: hypothetical protein JNM24_18565 [Bdellovibrionaceae bacterium]|nr:hypothetical protein [Pseudobdellovibrionaceae bacterium]
MKSIILFVVTLPLFSMAQDKTVFLCQSPTHTFQIRKTAQSKQLLGTLASSSQKAHLFGCETKDSGYFCKEGDFVAKVQRGTTGRMIIQLELEGEFDVESGYIDTIYCR